MSRRASGLKAWVVQRATAIYLALFGVYLTLHFALDAPADHAALVSLDNDTLGGRQPAAVHSGDASPCLGRHPRCVHGLPEAHRLARGGVDPDGVRLAGLRTLGHAGNHRCPNRLSGHREEPHVYSTQKIRRTHHRRRRRWPECRAAARQRRPARGGRLQGLSDPFPHRRRAGRRECRPGQRAAGQLALAHVRYRQGVRLPRRPGCHRVHVPRGHSDGLRARARRRAVFAARLRQDLPARLWRPKPEFRRRSGGAYLRRGGPNRSRHSAHPVSAERPRPDALLRRILRHRPDPRRGGRDPRRASRSRSRPANCW